MKNNALMRRFHEAGEQPSRNEATRPPADEVALRVTLLWEETYEAIEAMLGPAFCGRHGIAMKALHDAFYQNVSHAMRYQMNEIEGVTVTDPNPPGADADVVKVAGELADVAVVTYGAAEYYGVDLDKAYALVMDANMQKLPDCPDCEGGWRRAARGTPTEPCSTCGSTGKGRPEKREDGKILKPEGWEPADLNWALRRTYRAPEDVPELPREVKVGVDPATGAEALVVDDGPEAA